MKSLVISLGGSLIIPEEIDFIFLDKLKKMLHKHFRTHKFILVCGGGSIARKYIHALNHEKASEKQIALAGIRATRMNALFMMQLFGKEANKTLPMNMKDIKNELAKNNVVICGALRFAPHSTSDGTAARIANYLKTDFINMTDVKGLYSANPKLDKNAKFISKISWKDFEKMALALKFEAGQHFVLDQEAATIIKRHKITTEIIGKDVKNLSHLIENNKYIGTKITG